MGPELAILGIFALAGIILVCAIACESIDESNLVRQRQALIVAQPGTMPGEKLPELPKQPSTRSNVLPTAVGGELQCEVAGNIGSCSIEHAFDYEVTSGNLEHEAPRNDVVTDKAFDVELYVAEAVEAEFEVRSSEWHAMEAVPFDAMSESDIDDQRAQFMADELACEYLPAEEIEAALKVRGDTEHHQIDGDLPIQEITSALEEACQSAPVSKTKQRKARRRRARRGRLEKSEGQIPLIPEEDAPSLI